MTLAEFKKWLWDASEKDGWLMSVNGQTQEGTKTLPEIDEFRNAHLDAEILLLHKTEKDTDNARWMRLKARPDKVKTSHISKLRKWLWRDGGDDRWWLATSTEVIGDYYSLNEVAAYQERHPDVPLLVLHCSLSGEDPLPWVDVSEQ